MVLLGWWVSCTNLWCQTWPMHDSYDTVCMCVCVFVRVCLCVTYGTYLVTLHTHTHTQKHTHIYTHELIGGLNKRIRLICRGTKGTHTNTHTHTHTLRDTHTLRHMTRTRRLRAQTPDSCMCDTTHARMTYVPGVSVCVCVCVCVRVCVCVWSLCAVNWDVL